MEAIQSIKYAVLQYEEMCSFEPIAGLISGVRW